MVNALSAANAYKSQLKMMQGIGDGVTSSEEQSNAKSPFMQMVENSIGDAVNTQYKAEGVQMDALTGKADLVDLVTAINSAETTLNTIVTVRDRAISAYQEIIRMPI